MTSLNDTKITDNNVMDSLNCVNNKNDKNDKDDNCYDSESSVIINYEGIDNVMGAIPLEFCKVMKEFKIKGEYLNYDFDRLLSLAEELSEKSYEIDDELGRIIKYSSHLINFINKNLQYENNFSDFLCRIQNHK